MKFRFMFLLWAVILILQMVLHLVGRDTRNISNEKAWDDGYRQGVEVAVSNVNTLVTMTRSSLITNGIAADFSRKTYNYGETNNPFRKH